MEQKEQGLQELDTEVETEPLRYQEEEVPCLHAIAYRLDCFLCKKGSSYLLAKCEIERVAVPIDLWFRVQSMLLEHLYHQGCEHARAELRVIEWVQRTIRRAELSLDQSQADSGESPNV